jgi:uroporphyrin-3 C-methyltransferase
MQDEEVAAAPSAGKAGQAADTHEGAETPANDDAHTERVSATESVAKPSRMGTYLALLLALVAVGLSGFMYYRVIYLAPVEGLRAQVATLADSREAFVREITRENEALRRQLASLQTASEGQLRAVEDARASMLESLNEAINEGPPTQREWKLAEVEYLLRIANHRALMEHDVKAAVQLLSAADVILEELDDFALHQVRAQLADEILALKAVSGADLQGVYLPFQDALQ